MTLKEQLKSDLKDAMRAKEINKRDSIRSINTMIKQIEVDERIELDDAAIITLIQKGIKQREEAIAQYQTASRDDLVQKEIGGKVVGVGVDKIPSDAMMKFEYKFDRPEDVTEFVDEFQEQFEEAFEDHNFIIAGYKNYRETYDD